MSELIVVLGDQLFRGLPGMPAGCPVLMAEDMGLCTRTRHHQQKIVFFLSAMRHFAQELSEAGRTIDYVKLDPYDQAGYLPRLAPFCRSHGHDSVVSYEPNDAFFAEELHKWSAREAISVRLVPSQAFLTSAADWWKFAQRKGRLLMGDFYRVQRQQMGILLDAEGGPEGGAWSFDADNRKPLPKKFSVPTPWDFPPDGITQEVIELVSQTFPTHAGRADQFRYPVTASQAEEWLQDFVSQRLGQFGDYEDALSQKHRLVFHSLLSPLMNSGLLTPGQVLEAVVPTPVPLNSKEGFVRQVIGWREFVRGIDRIYAQRNSTEKPSQDTFVHRRQLGPAWYEGTTGLPPLDLVIQRARDHAYTHHIERLMVVGSAMFMAEVAPKAAYDWFMEMYIDSAEWVMRPNVFGMSQFADGGLFATKPYFSGSSYLLRMGDFARGPWCDVWDGLYWRLVANNLEFFRANPRMSMTVGGLERLDPRRRETIFSAAEEFIDRVTLPPNS